MDTSTPAAGSKVGHASLHAPNRTSSSVFSLRRLRHRIAAADNYALVLLLIVLSILVMAATDVAPVGRILALILVGGTLLYAMHTSRVGRLLHLASTLTVAAVGLAVVAVALTGRTGPAGGVDTAIAGLLVMITPIVIARRLVRHPAVNTSTIAGALCIYLLVGLFFAFLFGFTAAVGLGPFFVAPSRATDVDYLYFSFSTLATVGFGDLVASTNLGRMLAVTEALFGQMYLVTIVALLVGKFGRR
jgi:hypothetical protein